jgi:hypothetical protein
MGLLDEAIRDHLELKRRRGADPSEIARVEREALGPARSGPDALVEPAAPAPAYADEDAAHLAGDPALAGSGDDVPLEDDRTLILPEDPAAAYEPSALDPPVFDEPPPPAEVTEEPAYVDDAEPFEAGEGEDYLADAPEPEPASAASPAMDQPTTAYDVEAAEGIDAPTPAAPDEAASAPADDLDPAEGARYEPPPAASPPPEEDLLEETPEFLQETPEHDRLWFEQSPPRDFDFDD